MSKTVKVSNEVHRRLSELAFKTQSYSNLINDLVELHREFTNESEFRDWFTKNINLFGFSEIVEDDKSTSPDFHLKKNGNVLGVELETLSSHFKLHGHNPEKCDLVLCLKKDKDIDGVEVLEINSFEYVPPKNNRVTRTVQIRDDQQEWLEENPQVNFAGLVRKKLDEVIDDD